MVETGDFIYIKFDGPAAELGSVDIAKAGKALSALARWNRYYKKEMLRDKVQYSLKIVDIKKNCTELQIVVDIVQNAVKGVPVPTLLTTAAILNLPGVKDFIKGFAGELGKQLALKVFAAGKPVRESEMYVKNNKIMAKVINSDNQSMEATKEQIDFYRKSGMSLNGMYALEEGKENRLRVGYHDSSSGYVDTAEIVVADKNSFVEDNDPDVLARRMSESFDEEAASLETINGQFVDFYGLAHKYKFSFQVRNKQEEYGKQKILCIVEDSMVSEIIDLLKPENKKNVWVRGLANRDQEGKIDKIKIQWFNLDPDYNPNQTSLVKQ